jgi:L-gulonate 3-dehydrogenase
MKISLIGCGLVGGAWSLVFARAGFEVTVYDPSPEAMDTAFSFAKHVASSLEAQDFLSGQSADAVLSRLRPASSLPEAVGNADYIQESAPERLAVKQALYREMAPLAKPGAILANSTSGLPASSFTAEIPPARRAVWSRTRSIGRIWCH